MTPARSLACVALVVVLAACATPVHQLAIANGNHLRVVNADSGQELHDVPRYSKVMRLAYRPDGERLAIGVCFDPADRADHQVSADQAAACAGLTPP
jgi:hypothetical protein